MKTCNEIKCAATLMIKTIKKSVNISFYLNKNQTTNTNDRLHQNIQKLIARKRRIRAHWQQYRYTNLKQQLN
jgi:hypothetical protein